MKGEFVVLSQWKNQILTKVKQASSIKELRWNDLHLSHKLWPLSTIVSMLVEIMGKVSFYYSLLTLQKSVMWTAQNIPTQSPSTLWYNTIPTQPSPPCFTTATTTSATTATSSHTFHCSHVTVVTREHLVILSLKVRWNAWETFRWKNSFQ